MPKKQSTAVVLQAPRKILLQQFPVPRIGNEDLLLEMEACGVCGTDPKIYRGELDWLIEYPVILGDELLGHVAKVGERAAEKHRVKEGDRVIVGAKISCGYCHNCLRGYHFFCEQERGKGSFGVRSCKLPPHLWGGYSEYLFVPFGARVHKVPDTISTECAILSANVLPDAIHWVETLGQVKLGDTLVILGPGPQGLCSVVIAKEKGAGTIIVSGLTRDQTRLDLAKRLGADHVVNVEKEDMVERVREITGGAMADVAIETSGSKKAVQEMLDIVKSPNGICVHVSITGGVDVPLITQKIVFKELKFLGGIGHLIGQPASSIKLIEKNQETNKYPLDDIFNYKNPLEKTEDALRMMGREIEGAEPIKALVNIAK
jgi:alcohol dehydrogenase